MNKALVNINPEVQSISGPVSTNFRHHLFDFLIMEWLGGVALSTGLQLEHEASVRRAQQEPEAAGGVTSPCSGQRETFRFRWNKFLMGLPGQHAVLDTCVPPPPPSSVTACRFTCPPVLPTSSEQAFSSRHSHRMREPDLRAGPEKGEDEDEERADGRKLKII